MTICITCFIREVNASFGKPKPIAAISATTWAQKIKNCYTITLEIMHKESCKLTEPHWWITSIAAIILYPHESMVSFQSGKPWGMTGSELSSCTREMTIKRTNQIILYKKIKIIKNKNLKRKNVRPEIGCLKDEDPLSTCIATCDLVLQEWLVGTLSALLLTSLASLHQQGFLELLLPQVLPQPVISICAKKSIF